MATPISSHVKDKNSIFTARDEDMIFFVKGKILKFHQYLYNKLCSFTSLISQKFSDTAVILAIVVSKRCTQDLPLVNTQCKTQNICSSGKFLLVGSWEK